MMVVHNSPVLNSLARKPSKPFYFNTSEHLLRIGRQKASTLAEFHDRALVGVQSASGYAEGRPIYAGW